MRPKNRISMVATLALALCALSAACGTSVQAPPSEQATSSQSPSPPSDPPSSSSDPPSSASGFGVGEPGCGVTSVSSYSEENLRETEDLYPDAESAAAAFVDETLELRTSDPAMVERLEEGQAILDRVVAGEPLSTEDADRGDEAALSGAAELLALQVLSRAFDEGTIVAQSSETGNQTTYASPPGEVSASVSVLRAPGEPEAWFVEGHSWELPGSECDPRPDE